MLNIDDDNIQRIWNIDVTPIYMDMTCNKKVEKKNIEIKKDSIINSFKKLRIK